jgi:hypothetical protein
LEAFTVSTDSAASIQASLSLLEKTPILFETMLRDLPRDVLQWKPAADRWSISEVLAHLAHAEQVFSSRVRRFVSEESPALEVFKQPDPAGPKAYSKGVAGEHLAEFTGARRAAIALLRSLPESAGARTAQHSAIGHITLSQMMNEWASHDLGHLRQVAELYRARAFYPHAGPFQKYSDPKP